MALKTKKNKGIYKGIVVGTGAIGALLESDAKRPKPATHAGAFSAHKDTELVGLVDTDAAALRKAGKLFPNARRYASLAKALAAETPDLVAVATPPATHRKVIEEALAAGVHIIICEKPLATSVEDAKAIARLAKKHKATVVVNYQRRFFKNFKDARTRIKKGELGKIQRATGYYVNGAMTNASHLIDAAHFLLDDPMHSVSAKKSTLGTSPQGDLNAEAHFTTKGGIPLSLFPLDQSAYGIHELHIFGEKGALIVRDFGYTFEYVPAVPSVFKGMRSLGYLNTRRTTREESMVAGSLEEALRAAASGTVPESSALSARLTVHAVDALMKSAREKTTVVISY